MYFTLKHEYAKKCIRMGITVLKMITGEVHCQFYSRKLCFMSPLLCHCKMEFATTTPKIYLPGLPIMKIIAEKICLSVLYYTWKHEYVKKCIRMGITVLKMITGEVHCQFYSPKLCFMSPLSRRCKLKFATTKLKIYLPELPK